jgi:photosystem II stability/assembly factor-like uncharacterized protein/DNA-binding CsgD family transcriptional regulator
MAKRGRPRHPDLLTPREREVLTLIRDGLTNPQIAERLGIGVEGVKYHVSEILGKLGVSTREEAARWREGPPWWLGGAIAFSRPPLRALSIAGASVLVVGAIAGLVFLAVLLARGGGHGNPTSLMATSVGAATTPTPNAPDSFDPLYFVDDQHGWVAGTRDGAGVILATSDGGKTWQEQYSSTIGAVIDLSFSGPTAGLAIAAGIGEGALSTILRTDDGQTWQPISNLAWPVERLQFISSQSVWAFRRAAKDWPAALLSSEDAGLTWTATPVPVGTWSTCVTAPEEVWAATTGGQIWRSMDGGALWAASFVAPEPFQRLNGNRLACHTGGLVWSSFDGGAAAGCYDFRLYRTIDSGSTWVLADSGCAPGTTAVIDRQTAYTATWCAAPCIHAVSIKRTTDSGRTWETLPLSQALSGLSRLSCPDPEHCWILVARAGNSVGQTPDLLATSDGGKTWVQQYP